MNFKPATVFEIVRLIDLQMSAPGFCVLVAFPDGGDLFAELQRELEVQTGQSLGIIDAGKLDAISLIGELERRPEPVILIDGFEQWNNEQFTSLDINRSRLETGAFLIFRSDLSTVARLLDGAPNLRSFVGPNILVAVPDPSIMSSDEVEDRLNQLRSQYRLDDGEIVDRARNGALPAEPEFVEWLFLLGRSELVR